MTNHDASNIADSTDWLGTALPGLSSVESSLRCRVCRDFYKTPMITSCLHTFCSLCIRRSLANDGKCPACRAPDQDSKLRWNGALEEVVDAYVKTRPTVLSLARADAKVSRQSPKRKLDGVHPEDNGQDASRKRLRSSTRLSRARGEEATAEMVRQEADAIDDSTDEDSKENRMCPLLTSPVMLFKESSNTFWVGDDTLAACPICNRRMKEYLVFSHLDKCTGPSTSISQRSQEPPLNNLPISSPSKQQICFERLPAVNYSTLKDQALRKKMTDLGISSSGPRPLLERRHREWRTIWNANCDCVKPRSRAQLLRDLEVWERTQGGRISAVSRLGPNIPLVKHKDFDGDAWATKYSSSFKDLVANARRSRPTTQEPSRAESRHVKDDTPEVVLEERCSKDQETFKMDSQEIPGPSVDDSGDSEEESTDTPSNNLNNKDSASTEKADDRNKRVREVSVNDVAG